MNTLSAPADASATPAAAARSGKRPAVSVIIPARNAAHTLRATLASVQSQTWSEWEAIVIDDGSIDGTADLVSSLAAQDGRIHLVRSFGRGVSAARNLGVSMARARILAFLDADDLWLPTKLVSHLSYLQRHPDVGLSFDRVRFLSPEGEPSKVCSTARVGGLSLPDLLCENPASTASTLVVRRSVLEAVGDFDEQMRFAEDLELMVRIRCLSTWRVEGLPDVLTLYRTSRKGASSDLEAMHRGWQTLMAKVRVYSPELVDAYYHQAQAIHLRYLARRAARLRLPTAQGLDFLKRALRSHPLALLRQPRRTFGTLAVLALSACTPGLGTSF
jgi:glycosyltransferase involved in cell wall biosynthesis